MSNDDEILMPFNRIPHSVKYIELYIALFYYDFKFHRSLRHNGLRHATGISHGSVNPAVWFFKTKVCCVLRQGARENSEYKIFQSTSARKASGWCDAVTLLDYVDTPKIKKAK